MTKIWIKTPLVYLTGSATHTRWTSVNTVRKLLRTRMQLVQAGKSSGDVDEA